jgi:hypothetical protein
VSHTLFAERAYDPTAAAGRVAWQRPGGAAAILRDGAIEALPGDHPALGGRWLAWRDAGGVTVADAATSAPIARHPAPDAGVLAVSADLLAWRARDAFGTDRLYVLGTDGAARLIAEAAPPDELGRPAIAGASVLCHVAGPSGSRLLAIDAASGAQTVLRRQPGAQLSNPATDGVRLLYVRATGRDQELRLGALAPGPVRDDRTLLVHASSGRRDAEHEPGRERHLHRGRRPELPPRARPGVVDTLWTSALAADAAYVTRLHVRQGVTRTADVLRVALAAAG